MACPGEVEVSFENSSKDGSDDEVLTTKKFVNRRCSAQRMARQRDRIASQTHGEVPKGLLRLTGEERLVGRLGW